MYVHTVDYLGQDGHRPTAKQRVSRGFWINNVPRLVVICSLLGHKPVVDGTEGYRDDPGHRWVACDRCGVRPEAQGNLDPAHWDIGRRYTGAWTDQSQYGVTTKGSPVDPDNTSPDRDRTWTVPGPWPKQQTGTIGGQLVIGTGRPQLGFSLKVGNMGSEHTLAGDLSVPFLGSLYLHTERFGQGLQRRLNPTGYESKVIEASISATEYDHRLHWKVWANRDSHDSGTPRWKDGNLNLDLVERAFGPKRYSYTSHALPVMGIVRMPEGDDHQVRLTLKKQTLSRPRPAGRRPLEEKWTVDWRSRAGIPFRNHSWKGDCVYGSSVYVSDQSVTDGRWALEACAAIAAKIAADRTSYRWKAPQPDTTTDDGPASDPLGPGPDIQHKLCTDAPVPTPGTLFTLPDGYTAPPPCGDAVLPQDYKPQASPQKSQFLRQRPGTAAKLSVQIDGEYVPVEGVEEVTIIRLPECTEVQYVEGEPTIGITTIPHRVMVAEERTWADEVMRYAKHIRATAIVLPLFERGTALLTIPLQQAWERLGNTDVLEWPAGRARLTWPEQNDTAEEPEAPAPSE